MLLELAVGDAYGAGFEYAEPAFVAEFNTGDHYVQHRKHHDISPGDYTDDTQMTLAIAELLVDGDAWTRENLADRFVEVYRRDERYGYSTRIHTLLRTVRDGAELLATVDDNSDRSGAAMRVAPIGLLAEVADTLRYADVQARVTHDTEDAVVAAQAAALAVHYCHHRLGPTSDLPRWLDDRLPGDWASPWQGPVGAQGLMSVHAAVTALAGATRLSALLRTCVAYTGDVDTVAAIALAAGSRAADLAQDIPRSLHDGLENGRFGRDYCIALDARLLNALS
ncbi:ADP-ribosylglycohydrolase family protein [Pseudonocardia spinosispora]|uniref:ADP-ribosylglycohydrolase family protein n=1 Tax=Pseudonocardia spinosispora TaxID=103441 RepID=UPI0004254D76|nr:ADP-ribosylglycohydrolase family protein [Pseudonocardia spinosispora]